MKKKKMKKRRIKHNDLTAWFLEDHSTLPQWYLDDIQKFFDWLGGRAGPKATSSQAKKNVDKRTSL